MTMVSNKSGKSNNPYQNKERDKREKENERKRKIQRVYIGIADICVNIHLLGGELKSTEPEDEATLMKKVRMVEDYCREIRTKYKDVEKLQYSED